MNNGPNVIPEVGDHGVARVCRSSGLSLTAILLSAALWLSSLALPVWDTRSDGDGTWQTFNGWFPAMLGFMGILINACPAWFANLFLIPLMLTTHFRWKGGFWLGVTAFAVAATAYTFPAIYSDNDDAVIVGRRIGFYLWLGSFVILILAQLRHPKIAGNGVSAVRLVAVASIALSLPLLEVIFQVGVSPLEASLKNRDDLTGFKEILSRHPPKKDIDAALRWALRRDLNRGGRGPSQQVRDLVAAGADVNQTDEHGKTLLMEALPPQGSVPAVELLIHAGADVNARNRQGQTVLDVAHESYSGPETLQLLIRSGAGATTPTIVTTTNPASR